MWLCELCVKKGVEIYFNKIGVSEYQKFSLHSIINSIQRSSQFSIIHLNRKVGIFYKRKKGRGENVASCELRVASCGLTQVSKIGKKSKKKT